MNRIYQGRVTKVEVPKAGTTGKREWEQLDTGEEALWHHHQCFQDAVNLYHGPRNFYSVKVEG
jgi:hypothetical protein